MLCKLVTDWEHLLKFQFKMLMKQCPSISIRYRVGKFLYWTILEYSPCISSLTFSEFKVNYFQIGQRQHPLRIIKGLIWTQLSSRSHRPWGRKGRDDFKQFSSLRSKGWFPHISSQEKTQSFVTTPIHASNHHHLLSKEVHKDFYIDM